MDQEYHTLDKEIAVIKKDIDVIKNNHLFHIQKDISMIKRVVWSTGFLLFTNLVALVTYFYK
tara:strand:- start:1892 stop:2077 length:186 start_codon:yes stop_codon:yes gene_type:complete